MLQFIRNSQIYRRAALAALLALLLQVALPIFHHPAQAATAAQGLAALRICSMAAPAATPHNADKSLPAKAPSCPLCQAMHLLGGGYVPASDAVLIYSPRGNGTIERAGSLAPEPRFLASSAQPRAPPVLV